MAVVSVVIAIPLHLSSLGTKYASTTLFTGISTSRLSESLRTGAADFKMIIEIAFSLHFLYRAFVCYLFWAYLFHGKDFVSAFFFFRGMHLV